MRIAEAMATNSAGSCAVEPNRKVAYYKMLEAGLRIMPNNSRYEVEVWAHKTINEFIRLGLIIIEDDLG